MRKQYDYLSDKDFIMELELSQFQEQWVKITLLDFAENPIEEIEGEVTGGTLNRDGDSAVRCTCSLTCAVDAFTYNTDDIKMKYSINKKIFLELGITNTTDKYKEYDVIWFPQGVFYISNFALSNSATGASSISVSFKDKMATLDGTVGGVLPAQTRLDIVDTYENGVRTTKKVLIYDLILEVVNHFGGEDISNIIIDDIPRKIKRAIR